MYIIVLTVKYFQLDVFWTNKILGQRLFVLIIRILESDSYTMTVSINRIA